MFKKGISGNSNGRPKGSTTKPQIRSYFTDDEIKELVEDLKETAKTDTMIKKFLAEQIFGRSQQSMDLTSAGSELPMPIYGGLSKSVDEKDSNSDK